MPKVNMTARWVQGVAATDKQVDYFDVRPGGLILRVSAKGVKSWCVIYRHGGRQRRLTLGKYPPLSLADARELAQQAYRTLAMGEDPAMQKQARRNALTVNDLVEQYIERHAKPNKRTWQNDRRMLHRDVIPRWGRCLAADITRQDVMALLDDITNREAPIMANRVRGVLSKMFNWAISRYLLEHNPVAHVERPGTEHQRDRVLAEDEIRTLWGAWNALPAMLGTYFKVLLLTGQRVSEVRLMQWGDIDGEWWTIPGELTKNKLAHRMLLTEPVSEALRALQGNETYVFPSPQKRARPVAYQTIYVHFRQVLKDTGVACVLHDLRRTAASYMASMGINRLTIGKVLNHRELGVTAVYDRYGYDAEKRQALDAWAHRLMAIVGEGEPAKVISLRRGE